jgi:release factor glutamine methyltransferase
MTKDENWLLTEKYKGIQSVAFAADCARLKAGEPLAFVIGHVPFLNTTIWLDSRPLIPRVETEFWVHECHLLMKNHPYQNFSVLDLCAGSGAIGVATKAAFKEALVDFLELDPAHTVTIEKNLTINNVDYPKSTIYVGDLFAPLPMTAKYHYILSNPPYIDKTLMRTEESVLKNEPHLALFSDQSGLEHIIQIIEQSSSYLYEHGELWLEHEPEQSLAIAQLGNENGYSVYTHHDQYGVERYSRLVLQ